MKQPIPDELILNYLAEHQGRWTMLFDLEFSTWVYPEPRRPGSREQPALVTATIVPPDTRPRRLLARMWSLRRRELIGGCSCGCLGDFELTDAGLALIGKPRIRQYSGY